MSKKILLVETSFDIHKIDKSELNESTQSEIGNDGFMYLEGCIQAFDVKNKNGRIYPKNVLMPAVEMYMKNNIEPFIKNKTFLTPGELDHPDTTSVSGKGISHLLTKIWIEGNKIMGRVRILNTKWGREIQELINGGMQLGISSRGMGSIAENNGEVDIVGEDFEIICWDIVTDPSTPGAYIYPVINNNGSFDNSDDVALYNNENVDKKIDKEKTISENIIKIKRIRLN